MSSSKSGPRPELDAGLRRCVSRLCSLAMQLLRVHGSFLSGIRALSIVTETTRKCQTLLRRTIRSPPRQSRQIAQNLRRRAPRFRIGRRALSIMTEMSRKGQTAGPCACQYKIDAKNPVPDPQAGGGRPATGRLPSRLSSRRRCRAGPLAAWGARGVGGVMAHPAAVAAAHPAKAVAEDCRICIV